MGIGPLTMCPRLISRTSSTSATGISARRLSCSLQVNWCVLYPSSVPFLTPLFRRYLELNTYIRETSFIVTSNLATSSWASAKASRFQLSPSSVPLGDIYLGINIVSGEEDSRSTKLESFKSYTLNLSTDPIYKRLPVGCSIGVPFVRWFRTRCDYNARVLDLFASSSLVNFRNNRKFSLKTFLDSWLLAGQLVCRVSFKFSFSHTVVPQISRIEYIHVRTFIHDNFPVGISKRGNLCRWQKDCSIHPLSQPPPVRLIQPL